MQRATRREAHVRDDRELDAESLQDGLDGLIARMGGRETVSRLGFLGAPRFVRESPCQRLLEKLGFAWIPSSKTRHINGLGRILVTGAKVAAIRVALGRVR
jgi:hypothetical protein